MTNNKEEEENNINIENLNLSPLGVELFDSAINIVEDLLKSYGKLRTQVFYPKVEDNGEVEILSVELSKILDQIIEEFGLKPPFDNKDSLYFSFFKETALNILKIKIETDSPNLYIFANQIENEVYFIIRDPSYFGITKVTFIFNGEILIVKKIEHLPSNNYTNPLFISF
jgi:glycerophosphoryl diester phosphodiesterase